MRLKTLSLFVFAVLCLLFFALVSEAGGVVRQKFVSRERGFGLRGGSSASFSFSSARSGFYGGGASVNANVFRGFDAGYGASTTVFRDVPRYVAPPPQQVFIERDVIYQQPRQQQFFIQRDVGYTQQSRGQFIQRDVGGCSQQGAFLQRDIGSVCSPQQSFEEMTYRRYGR